MHGDAMCQDVDGEVTDVLGNAVVAAIHECAGLCRAPQGKCAARRSAERESIVNSRRFNQVEQVADEGLFEFDRFGGFLKAEQISGRKNALE